MAAACLFSSDDRGGWFGVVDDPDVITVLLGGDVILGRGVDQILPASRRPRAA